MARCIRPEMEAVAEIGAGTGTITRAILARGLPPEAIPAGGAAGSAAYLVGVFGPSVRRAADAVEMCIVEGLEPVQAKFHARS